MPLCEKIWQDSERSFSALYLRNLSMPDLAKQEYYIKNRKKRLKYQRAYYKRNKKRIKKARESRKLEDPEWAANRKEYNRNYYAKNKARLMAQRSSRGE